MDRDDLILAYCNSGYTEDEAATLADNQILGEMDAANRRRQAVQDELTILSRHLADPDNNPL